MVWFAGNAMRPPHTGNSFFIPDDQPDDRSIERHRTCDWLISEFMRISAVRLPQTELDLPLPQSPWAHFHVQ